LVLQGYSFGRVSVDLGRSPPVSSDLVVASRLPN
jgi:hypothetical protein